MSFFIKLFKFWPIFLFFLRGVSFFFCLLLIFKKYIFIISWRIFYLNSSFLNFNFILDSEGLFFSGIVIFISANVLIFSKTYIKDDKNINYFTFMVLIFILSINFLIFIPNIIVLLLGWDGLGITSFILVFYYQTPKSLRAGIITALTNRVGDVLILISMAWIFNNSDWIITLKIRSDDSFAIFLLIIASCTKRAQIPFRRWLPAAIAAPTPVSALVHSSTLVTAGIFLLFRFKESLYLSPLGINILIVIRVRTIIMAGTAAIIETDMKKIIALSTLSQLGVIITRTALFLPLLTFFHLVRHALFKALIFICAGNIITYNNHAQDLRSNSLSIYNLPIMFRTLIISNFSLMGFPFMAGFFSKDIIIECSSFIPSNLFLRLIFFFATVLTAIFIKILMKCFCLKN